jgi:AcrR family transcriptional regulator
VRRADLSKGTFYWTFDDKDDLFGALLEERLDRPARDIVTWIGKASANEPTSGGVSLALAQLFGGEREAILLLHEYWSAAVRDADVAQRYRRRHTRLRRTLADALAARHAVTGVPLALAAEDLAEAFIALGTGLSASALVDDGAVHDRLFGEVASLIYDGMVHRARQGSPREKGPGRARRRR